MINHVEFSAKSKKQLLAIPHYIARKLLAWIEDVETRGLDEVRKISGYHDEPLHGDRKGERSIRLNKAYRAIYVIKKDGSIEFVEITEVNKHDY